MGYIRTLLDFKFKLVTKVLTKFTLWTNWMLGWKPGATHQKTVCKNKRICISKCSACTDQNHH